MRQRKGLSALLLALLVAVPGSLLVARHVDRSGWAFFDTGKTIVQHLGQLASAAKQRNLSGIADLYAEDFRGEALGFAALGAPQTRDDVRIYAFGGDRAEALDDRSAAIDEWRRYLDGFAEIEEVGLYIHRLERWRGGTNGELVASVRFELIGTPQGEPRSGIDRGFFRMHFAPVDGDPETLRITRSALIEGDRVISAVPHFVDVAADAGVAFENRYYPAFLEQDLKFKMLRYGPAGITAADIDRDGFHDLFVPDGEASRLYRNAGDGTFVDITAAAGLAGLDGVGVGLFADIDNDGDKDFFVSRTFAPNQLFRNEGWGEDGIPRFVDVTAASGMRADCCTTVASFGDIDNDGFLDLYVGRYLDPRTDIPTTFYARNGEPNQLYHNNGDGTFTNITESAGVGELGLCLGTVFGDYDDDGDADLYVVNDFGRKTLYRNNGDLTFDDVTVETGTLAYGAGMSASFGDYDNDADLDIYIAHIRSEEGWFAESPTVLRYMLNTWRQGVWVSDMPLYFEIFRQSGFGFVQVFQDMASGNTLLRNDGDGTFSDVTWDADANPPGWFWGSGFADFDNDGWQDLYSANGWVYNDRDSEIELEFLNNVVSEMKTYKTGYYFDPNFFGARSWHGWERNRHLINQGDGTFKEIGRATGTDLLTNSRGTAYADFWNRGVIDIAVAGSTDTHALLRNDVGLHRDWLQVELVGDPSRPDGSNRDAVGARVIVEAGGQTMMREIALGDGYGSQNTLRLHFGLMSARDDDSIPTVERLTVRWPRSGAEQVFERVEGNRIVRVVEMVDALEPVVYAAPPAGDASTDAMPAGEELAGDV
ncbi:MAG: CRTAC1 family protein [Acidobacteriota bacterium]